MPFRQYLVILALALAAAAITVGAAVLLLPGQEWAGPAVMAVLATLALATHAWRRRK